MKKILLAAFAILSISTVAAAGPIDLPSDTPVFFQFTNIEQVDTSLSNAIDVPGTYGTAGNWGVVLVSQIAEGAISTLHQEIQGGGDPLFNNGGVNGNQIWGIFYGIQLDSGTLAHAGTLDLYWHDAAAGTGVDANCMAGNTCAPDINTVNKFTSGTKLVSINFASGVNAGNADCTTTIKSSLDLTGQITGQGQADSYGNVNVAAGGAWANALNNDWFFTGCGTRDIRFSNFFNLQSQWNGSNGVLGLRSNDPARALTVPEPLTLGLFGLGLAGLGVRMRRKTNV